MVPIDPQVVEECADDVVGCIRHFVDGLREDFPPQSEEDPSRSPPIYTRMVERGILKELQMILERQRRTLNFVGLSRELSAMCAGERVLLVHAIILPLLQSLTACYRILDALPEIHPPPSTPEDRRRSKTKPLPPRGMLSIQNYTDIACLLEFTVCTGILPLLETHLTISIEDRIQHHLPRSLAGRISRKSLSWGVRQPITTFEVQPKGMLDDDDDDDDDDDELYQTASAIAALVGLERFRPMLLPRHITDIYAALFQSENSLSNETMKRRRIESPLYVTLGLAPWPRSAVTLDASLQAKAYQTLLLQGTKAPSWIRQRVSPLLTKLACTSLASIVQVFVPLQEPSMASQRLGLALATSSSTNVAAAAGLGRQMRMLLEVLFPMLYHGEIPAQAMAILQTIWAVLNQWPDAIRQRELIAHWQYGMGVITAHTVAESSSDGNAIHKTIRQIGALCAFVPPSTTEPLSILRQLLLPSSDKNTSIFHRLIRVASMPSVLVSQGRLEAHQALQWLSHAIYNGSRTKLDNIGLEVSGPNFLASAWVHGLSPNDWDLSGYSYKLKPSVTSATGQGKSTMLETIKVEKSEDVIAYSISSLTDGVSKRVHVFSEITLDARSADDTSNENKEPDNKQSMLALPSLLFRLLLKTYLSNPNGPALDASNLQWAYQLVAAVLLPFLSEKCAPETLLFGDGSDALGLLNLIKLILGSAQSLLNGDVGSNTADVTNKDLDVETMLECLQIMDEMADANANNDSPQNAEAPSPNSDHSETLLSISSIVLSLLIAVLELGSRLRSKPEEMALRSFLPILQSLTGFRNISGLTTHEQANAGIADMAGYAMALIASREVKASMDQQEHAVLSPMKKLEAMIQEAEEDLTSSQPPMRARGMVTLGRLARGYLGSLSHDKRSKLVTELKDTIPDAPVVDFLVNEVLRLSMIALADTESYVYLAAVQTLVAIGDMKARQVFPVLASAMVSGIIEVTRHESASHSFIELSQEQRIKLAEALMFIIRRRAAPDAFVPLTMNLMLFGDKDRIGSVRDRNSLDVTPQLYANTTEKYFLGLDENKEAPQSRSQKQKWEEQDIRLKTGGPMFAMEEADIVRSLRLSILAEIVSVARPSSSAPHCHILVRLIIDVLQLDKARSVRRAAAFLAREMYHASIREEEELASLHDCGNSSTSPLPLAVALLSSDESELLSTLQDQLDSASNGLSDKQVADPATSARCREALEFHDQAEELGIFTAAQLIISKGERSKILPGILTGIAEMTTPAIVEIDKAKGFE